MVNELKSIRAFPLYSAYRSGFADALFGRECCSPWKDAGWKAIRRNAEYLDGYMRGQEVAAERKGAGKSLILGDTEVAGTLSNPIQWAANEHNID